MTRDEAARLVRHAEACGLSATCALWVVSPLAFGVRGTWRDGAEYAYTCERGYSVAVLRRAWSGTAEREEERG